MDWLNEAAIWSGSTSNGGGRSHNPARSGHCALSHHQSSLLIWSCWQLRRSTCHCDGEPGDRLHNCHFTCRGVTIRRGLGGVLAVYLILNWFSRYQALPLPSASTASGVVQSQKGIKEDDYNSKLLKQLDAEWASGDGPRLAGNRRVLRAVESDLVLKE